MVLDRPRWIYDKSAYFSVIDKTIFCKKEFSSDYYHELQHYKDWSNPGYKRIGMLVANLNQILNMAGFPFLIMVAIISRGNAAMLYETMYSFLILYIPVWVFVLQEEVRAYINQFRKIDYCKL